MTNSNHGEEYIECDKLVEKLSIDLKNGEGVEHALNKILEIGAPYSILKRHHIKHLLKFDDPNILELAKEVKTYIYELRDRKRERKASKKVQLEQDQVEDLDDAVQQDEPAASGSSSNDHAGKSSRKRKNSDDLLGGEKRAKLVKVAPQIPITDKRRKAIAQGIGSEFTAKTERGQATKDAKKYANAHPLMKKVMKTYKQTVSRR